MTIPQAFALALQHHQSGRLAEAEGVYRQILSVEPQNADTLHLLGVIAHQVGRNDVAVELIRKATALRPDFGGAHYNLGISLGAMGRFDEAIAAYHRAISILPHDAEVYSNLGNALRWKGQMDEAIVSYRHAIALKPDYPEAHYNLGVALNAIRQFDQAILSCRKAIALKPDYPEAHSNLGGILHAVGQLDDALAACRRAIALRPDYAGAHYNLGVILNARGQLDEAMGAYELALQLKPDMAEAHNNLGEIFLAQARHEEAISSYRRALDLKPASLTFHSNYLASLQFSPKTTPARLLAAHAEYDERHGAPLCVEWRDHGNTPDPERRLKVGYVSPDFRHNVIGHFLMPLLEAHDRTQFETYCYASLERTDAITERFMRTSDVWRDVGGLRDEALAEQIREDRIDVLVDLSQHMIGNRLLVFARKPAPVQVAWLGHPWSTGLRAIDYRLTDACMEPAGSAWSESVEEPVRLPDSWFCFDPIDEYPDTGELPALSAGYVTFGCLNSYSKVNEAVLHRWAGILSDVENSRLLLRCPAGETQARVRNIFETHGVNGGRVEFAGWTQTRDDYLRLFQRMDVALDPSPYNGGTTTCDTLWMGVPVLTLPGEMVVSRIGLSILAASGMTEFVAHSEGDYVRLAVSLAADLPRLAQLRSTLRGRMKASAFMDAPRFARNVEHAYRQMWRTWCANQTSASTT